MSSSRDRILLTREQLFERIWSTPMLRLAGEFGISDVAIAKHCQRRNIPRPPPGYWAKFFAGQPLPRPSLPTAREGEDRPVKLAPPATARPAEPAVARASMPFPTVEPILPTADQPLRHPIAERVRHCLTRYKHSGYGLVRINEPGLPRITASPAQAERIAGFLHSLTERAAVCSWALHTEGDGPLEFRVGSRGVVVWIKEPLRPESFATTRRKCGPGGALVIHLGEAGHKRREIQRWEESPEQPLGPIMERLFVVIGHVLASGHAEQAAVFPTPRKKLRGIRDQVSRLRLAAKKWDQHCLLERYIDACEAHWRSEDTGVSPGRLAWLSQAREVARILSPFSSHEADVSELGPSAGLMSADVSGMPPADPVFSGEHSTSLTQRFLA